MEGQKKVMSQDAAKELLNELGKEFKPAGENVKAVIIGGEFYLDTEEGAVHGNKGDVIYETSQGVKTMSKDEFLTKYQKA